MELGKDANSNCGEVFLTCFLALWPGTAAAAEELERDFFNVLFCTVAWKGGGGDTEGPLSASATTFCGPGICLTSVVNSDMYAICLTCREDHSGETRFMACVSGIWSVSRRIAEKAANKVEYLTSAEFNFLLKKAKGDQDPDAANCCKTPPTWVSDASTARDIVGSGVGCTKTVHFASASLPATKAAAAVSDHSNFFGLPRNKSVKGWRMPAIPGKNLL